MIHILFLGDIFGRPGRQAVKTFLPRFKQSNPVDLCIANCENLTNGRGASKTKIAEMQEIGVSIFSSGNHLWDKREEYDFIKEATCIAKPMNYPQEALGFPHVLTEVARAQIMLITLCGQTYMSAVNSPFLTLEAFLNSTPNLPKCIIVDFHAESTAEKRTFGFFYDGKITAMLGTHTHIQTADEEILPQGTAYITDVGMCGPHDSVIGIRKEIAIERARTAMPVRHIVAENGLQINAVYLTVDELTGQALAIKRIREAL